MILHVPEYDFQWQHTYAFREPVFAPEGSVLRLTLWWDNSEANPANPDPTARVHWGEQTWEEMMIGYIDWHRLTR